MAGTDGMDPRFASALDQMIRDSGGKLWIVSGYRSVEEQTALWNKALSDYGGDENAARQWVAPPGKSNHNHGIAADLGYTDGGLEWAHANASRYGLYYPMEWEPWHVEPMGSRDNSPQPTDDSGMQGSPYTDPPAGYMAVDDPARNSDLGVQLQRAFAMLTAPVQESDPPKTHPEIYT